jgi:hypothetical protein
MQKVMVFYLVAILLSFAVSGCAAAPTAVPATTAPATAEPVVATAAPTEAPVAFEGYYTMQTAFLEAENKCLEGNRVAADSVLGGAAFMDDCNGTSGQLWKLVPASDGYYTLQTAFLEAENKCLEGNRVASDSVLGGAAFMDDCTGAAGQLWKLVPASDGYYTLQTAFLEAENKCLEGNRVASDSVLGGAAFMDDCNGTSGQLWKFVQQQ